MRKAMPYSILRALVVVSVTIALAGSNASAQKRAGIPKKPDPKAAAKLMRVELTAGAQVKVRLKSPPPRFDEKGRPKKYTSDELKQLKGDDPADQKLAGYKSDYTNLKKGDIVQVTLGVPRRDRSDKDKSVVSMNGPQITGRISEFGESDNKVFLLEIPVAQAGVLNNFVAKDLNYARSGSKITVEAAQAQAALIIVLQEGAGQETPEPKGKGKKKDK